MSESANWNNAKRRGCLKSGAAMKEVVSPGSKPIRILAADGHPKLCQAIRDERQMRSRATLLLFAICATLAGCHPGTSETLNRESRSRKYPNGVRGIGISKTLLKELCAARGKGSKLLSTPSAGDCGGCSRCLRLLLRAFCPRKIGEMKCILGPNTLLCYLILPTCGSPKRHTHGYGM